MQQLKKLYPNAEITQRGNTLEMDLPFAEYADKDGEIIENIRKNTRFNRVNVLTNYAQKFIKVYAEHDPKYTPPTPEERAEIRRRS